MLGRWVEAGCQIVIVHVEATRHLHHTLSTIRGLGVRAGVALSPATPLQLVSNVLHLTDLLLVMTVEPGFGGQPYLAEMEPKIAAARAEIDRRGLQVELEVDGGITTVTIGTAARAAPPFSARARRYSTVLARWPSGLRPCATPPSRECSTNDIALMRGVRLHDNRYQIVARCVSENPLPINCAGVSCECGRSCPRLNDDPPSQTG